MARILRWGAGISGVILVGFGVWLFFSVGLDKSDKIASSAGLFVGVAGLAVSIYSVIIARRQAAVPPTAPSGGQPRIEASGEGSVAAQTIFGNVVTGDHNHLNTN
ncbi:hypothetical protein [Nonomuraea sp. NPDC049695]|uniref:hypothetical protein n=1 Tax=Nonomuraea sp. NPDC049695 TaxID=3154734 RepID=UPI00343C8B1F